MFLKLLRISSGDYIIRELKFKKGINLIIDKTPQDINLYDKDVINNENSKSKTGNNVGKTTVLKLVDFCLGGKGKAIYSDMESDKKSYDIVKNYLIDNEVLITLILTKDLESLETSDIIIERNFLSRKKLIRRINGEQFSNESKFESKLKELLFENANVEKPSFRQIISHNIRYKDYSLNNTLKTIDPYTKNIEYETLYLYLLDCNFEQGEEKQSVIAKLNQEISYKERLEKYQTKTAYEASLSLIEDDIQNLNIVKDKLNINENFEKDLSKFNDIKYKINKISFDISNLELRKELILESKEELKAGVSDIDLLQLRTLYEQVTNKVSNIQKTFEDLVKYHNRMIFEKIKFIEKDLPELDKEILDKKKFLESLLEKEKGLAEIISKSDSFKELEKIIAKINDKYREKGEYEGIISQIEEVEENIERYNLKLLQIGNKIFSEEFEDKLKAQINKFNKYFSGVSQDLYGERYAIKYDIVEDKNKQRFYQFSSFNANMSSGKKQGEILCFDIAYILFADSENIPCAHFLLNDKKELMHNNQLRKIVDYIKDKNIQLIISILEDKLPDELKNNNNYIAVLSQEDKLFRIEKHNL